MTLKLIGAGYGRTGTLSAYTALNRLGFPCYHMFEVIENKANKTHLDFWRRVANTPAGTRHAWEQVFSNYLAAVDNPASCVWRELMEAYPDAKVLLTLHPRGPDAWYESVIDTIYFTESRWQFKVLQLVTPFARKMGDMCHKLIWQRSHKGTMTDRGRAIAEYNQHIEDVKAAVPADRLLIFSADQGWEPLCKFMGVPVPDGPFPNVNDRAQIKKVIAGITVGAYVFVVLAAALAAGLIYGVARLLGLIGGTLAEVPVACDTVDRTIPSTRRIPMRHLVTTTITAVALAAGAAAHAASPAPSENKDFVLHDSGAAKEARGTKASKIEPTKTEAAMRFTVVEKEKGPIKGVVIFLTAPNGYRYYTAETDADGYGEVLVPAGQKYEVTYLSLGRHGDIAATVTVTDEPRQNVKLTLRYKRQPPPPPFVLMGVTFDTGKATIRSESYPLLDVVVEFMAHKRSARIEISGHTDNAGNRKTNKVLSQQRAQSCRAYIVTKGIDADRLDAVGYGDEHPIAPNDTDEGRQKNRRIEVKEILTDAAATARPARL